MARVCSHLGWVRRFAPALLALLCALSATSATVAQEREGDAGRGTPSHSAMVQLASLNWEEESSWIKALEMETQIAVISVIRDVAHQSANDVMNRLEQNAADAKEAALGLMKQMALVDSLLAGLATSSADQRAALSANSDLMSATAWNITAMQPGELAAVQARSRELEGRLNTITNTIDKKTWDEVKRQSAAIHQTTARLLARVAIGEAAVSARQ